MHHVFFFLEQHTRTIHACQMPGKGKPAEGNWSLYPLVTSFVNLRWELNRNGRIVVFGRDAPLTCTGYSAVKQVTNFVVPVQMGEADTKVRVVIHAHIYDLLILMNESSVCLLSQPININGLGCAQPASHTIIHHIACIPSLNPLILMGSGVGA